MKTYSVVPLVMLSLIAGVFLTEGLTLAFFAGTPLGGGGAMTLAGVTITFAVDRIYRNCRIVERRT